MQDDTTQFPVTDLDLARDQTVYQQLAAPTEHTFKDSRGGFTFDYITGEQCITRLNTVLGAGGWSFRVLEHGYNQQADEMWVLAELKANIVGNVVVRQQFGSQKVKHPRGSEAILDIGFDLKGATTDAMKKCAMAIGVGLWLSAKEEPAYAQYQQQNQGQQAPQGQQRQAPPANNQQDNNVQGFPPQGDGPIVCAQCGEELKDVRFRDGTIWTPAQLASFGRRKHGRALCMSCYREANEARKRAEQVTVRPNNDPDSIPF